MPFEFRDFFSTGMSNARFHALGTTPVPREMLMMCVITGVSSAAQLRKTQCGMSSGPGDIFFILWNLIITLMLGSIRNQCYNRIML